MCVPVFIVTETKVKAIATDKIRYVAPKKMNNKVSG